MRVLLAVSCAFLASSAVTSACTYAISPGGQVVAQAGGIGTINVVADAGCSWNVVNDLPNWIVTNPNFGMGNGTVTYQVAANLGADRAWYITVARNSFAVVQTGAVPSGLNNMGSMAQLAVGGAWSTTITLVNTGTAPVQARLNFFDDTGNPLTIQLFFPQGQSLTGPLAATLFPETVNPGAGLVIQAYGASQQLKVGWVQLLASGNLSGFAVFQQSVGASVQEAEIPFETRNPSAFDLWFDNTAGYSTGIALANTSSQAVNIPVIIRDDTGALLLSSTIALGTRAHASFDLGATYPLTSGIRGTVEFGTPIGGQISVLGLRFNPTGAFSSIPALPKF